jgi:hypothetical protein
MEGAAQLRLFNGIEVIVDPYLEGPKQIRFPKRGPYFRRRMRRYAANPNNWEMPQALVIEGRIYCHPVLYDRIRQLVPSA